MENTNMDLWREAFITDPSAVKKITGKPYQGDSPKPYWLIQRATEIFGACGFGWGVDVKSESFFRMSETDVMHTAVVTVWYMRNGQRCQIEQMGQTKACYLTSSGKLMLDEDAGKKSVTDGMVKCLSMIGFAGDIFSGLWNDSKYVEYAAAETDKRNAPPPIDYIKAIEESTDIQALKNHFAAAWKMTPKADHVPLKTAYDKRTKELTEGKPE